MALTIAGSDSGGGAGIQADLLTFAAFGVFGTTAITCVTAQNPDGVRAVEAMAPEFVRAQLDAVSDYFALRALKTGMLYNREIIVEAAGFLERNPGVPAVVDPVMVSTSGALLLREDAVAVLREELLPRAALITPNCDEIRVLLGSQPESHDALLAAAEELSRGTGTAVLAKGGHLPDRMVCDVLAVPGESPRSFRRDRIADVNTHGGGCTLAAAIAAGLARGNPLPNAVTRALDYVATAMHRPIQVAGNRFISRFA